MKKIYSLIGAVALSMSVQAQVAKQYSSSDARLVGTKELPTNFMKTATPASGDTVGWNPVTDFVPEFGNGGGNLTIYGLSGDGGYIYGKNGGGISTCAQGYLNLNGTSLVITKALLWAAVKEPQTGGTPTASVTVSIWDMAPNKARHYIDPVPPATTGTFTLDAMGPNTKKGTAGIFINDIDTTNGVFFSVASFSTPVVVAGNFAIVADCNTLAALDTIGFLSDAVGAGGGNDLTYHRATNGNWYVTDGGIFADGALNNNIAFFAVLGTGTAVKEFVNGVKLSDVFPNPSNEAATIQYSLEKSSNEVGLVVYDMNGRKVYDETFKNQATGTYTVKLNTASYAAGSYFYQLRSNGAILTKEFIVTK